VARGLLGGGQQAGQGRGVGTAGDRLRDVARGVQATVGDDVHVAATRLVEVVAAGRGGVGDGGGHRDVQAQGVGRGGRTGADDDAGGAGAHQVQRGAVVDHATGDDRHVQAADEVLQVQRLALGGDELGGNQGALDDQQVNARLHDDRG